MVIIFLKNSCIIFSPAHSNISCLTDNTIQQSLLPSAYPYTPSFSIDNIISGFVPFLYADSTLGN